MLKLLTKTSNIRRDSIRRSISISSQNMVLRRSKYSNLNTLQRKRMLSLTINLHQNQGEIEKKSVDYTPQTIHGLLILNRQHQTFKLLIQEPIFYLNFNLSGALSKNLSLAPQQIILQQIIKKYFYDWSTFREFASARNDLDKNITGKSRQMIHKSRKETENLISRFQGMEEAMGKLSDSLLDKNQIQWQFFDQRQSENSIESSIFFSEYSQIRKTQYMENLFDPLSKIGSLHANVSFDDELKQNVILYKPGKFAYFDGGLVALITDKSFTEEICKAILMYLFYSSKKQDIQIFQKLLQESGDFFYENLEYEPKIHQTINFSIVSKNSEINPETKSSKTLANLQNYFLSLGLSISFFESSIENDDQLSNFDQASSFFRVNGNEKSSSDEITDEIDRISSLIIWNLEES